MDNKFTPELIEKAKEAKTSDELMSLAKENGVELTGEDANTYFEQLNPKTGELSDDEPAAGATRRADALRPPVATSADITKTDLQPMA